MMTTTRACRAAGLALAALLVALGARADSGPASGYPARPIRIIASTTPGSPPDLVARVLSERLAAAFGQPVTVENRPGASNTIGLHAVAKAAPDGYTLGILSPPGILAPSLLPRVPYDTAVDLAPVSQVTWGTNILVVHTLSPMKSVEEMIALAKAKPGQITFASGGNGTPAHIAGELFRVRAGINIRHVPFKGAPAGVTAVLGEQVDMMFAATSASAPHIRSGKLRALATPAADRLPSFPEVKTMAELGLPDFDLRDWHGVVAPAGTPREIIAKVASEIARITSSPEAKERFASMGMDAASRGPDEFGIFIRSELKRFAGIVREANIRAD